MMLDAPLAPEADAEASVAEAQARLAIIDGDVHPALRSLADLKPYMPARWWDVLATYGTRRRHGMSFEPYPKSAPRACRRDAWPETAGRPAAISSSSARSTSITTASRTASWGRSASPARARSTSTSPAALASAVNDWQREHLHQARAAPALRHRRALRGRRRGGQGDRALRARSGLRAGVHADAHVRAGRQSPLLADLRGGRAPRPAGRAARVRRQRASLHGRRLAVLLHRGGRGPLHLVPDRRHQPRHRGRVRALPEPQGRDRRRRLRLAGAADVAARQAVRAHARRGRAPEAQAVRVHPRAHLGHDPAHGGARRPQARARHDGVDRLGPPAVRLRLPALGLRRSVPRVPCGTSEGALRSKSSTANAKVGVPAAG